MLGTLFVGGVIAQPNVLVRHPAGIELGNIQVGNHQRLGRDIESSLVKPLFPEPGVKLAVTQMVCTIKETVARANSGRPSPLCLKNTGK